MKKINKDPKANFFVGCLQGKISLEENNIKAVEESLSIRKTYPEISSHTSHEVIDNLGLCVFRERKKLLEEILEEYDKINGPFDTIIPIERSGK